MDLTKLGGQLNRFGKIFSCSLFGKWAVVSADPNFNRFIMQNEGKLFQSSYPKSFRDLVGKNGVITVHGEQQRKLHAIASNMMRLDKLKFNFLKDIQMVMLQTLGNFHNNQVIFLQDICRKARNIYAKWCILEFLAFRLCIFFLSFFGISCLYILNYACIQVAINLMVNQLLGVTSDSEVNEMAQLFSVFVDGCLSVPINLQGFTYHAAMKVSNIWQYCVSLPSVLV